MRLNVDLNAHTHTHTEEKQACPICLNNVRCVTFILLQVTFYLIPNPIIIDDNSCFPPASLTSSYIYTSGGPHFTGIRYGSKSSVPFQRTSLPQVKYPTQGWTPSQIKCLYHKSESWASRGTFLSIKAENKSLLSRVSAASEWLYATNCRFHCNCCNRNATRVICVEVLNDKTAGVKVAQRITFLSGFLLCCDSDVTVSSLWLYGNFFQPFKPAQMANEQELLKAAARPPWGTRNSGRHLV